MRVDFKGRITTVTELTYSYADSRKEGSLLMLPVFDGRLAIPGRLIRGRLRHCNFAPIVRERLKLGERLSLEDWQFNLLGGIRQEGQMNYNVLLDRPLFEQHPFVGTWGCMEPVAYGGKVQVEMAIAPAGVKPVLISGQRTDPVQRGEATRDNVPPDEFDAYIAMLGANSADRAERQARAAEAKKNRGKPKNGDEEVVPEPPRKLTPNLPFSRQMIPRGIEFEHYMTLKRDATPLQVGQFLMALEEFSADPFLGAQSGINGGVVDMHYTVSVDGKPFGELRIDGRAASIVFSPSLQEFRDLFWDEFPKMVFSVPALRAT